MNLALLTEVQTRFAAVHAASSALLPRLSLVDIQTDLILAASNAGLAMLAQSGVDLSTLEPGSAVLGAVPDDLGQTVTTFVLQYAVQNGLDSKAIRLNALTAEQKNYAVDTGRFARVLAEVCAANQLDAAMHPFVAATAAVKLVLGGQRLHILEPGAGLTLVMFHIAAGCKTVPFRNVLN